MRRRTDSEHHQALLRALIVTLLLFNTAWVAADDPRVAVALWSINVSAVALSVLLFAHILYRPRSSAVRRVLGALHDNAATTLWLYHCGPLGALALFVYPFVTVGNGFRYGVRYLAGSGVLGAVGIGILLLGAPAWSSHGIIGAGVLLSHIVVTIYTGALLRRLHGTQVELERMATCDALTGLPNRRFFLERLDSATTAPGRPNLACLYLDLDGFKSVNDSLGHRAGDELLVQVARRLLSATRGSDTVARLGGDEFTVLLDAPMSPDAARIVAARIIAGIQKIELVDGHRVQVSASIGIAFATRDACAARGALADEMVRVADEAMYVAKRSGKGRCELVELVHARLDMAA